MKCTCAAVFLILAGCHAQRATEADCDRIFNRLVDVELRELGYRDPALGERKRGELHKALAGSIRACSGGRMPADALACVGRASTAEEIVHQCLE